MSEWNEVTPVWKELRNIGLIILGVCLLLTGFIKAGIGWKSQPVEEMGMASRIHVFHPSSHS